MTINLRIIQYDLSAWMHHSLSKNKENYEIILWKKIVFFQKLTFKKKDLCLQILCMSEFC